MLCPDLGVSALFSCMEPEFLQWSHRKKNKFLTTLFSASLSKIGNNVNSILIEKKKGIVISGLGLFDLLSPEVTKFQYSLVIYACDL